MGHVRGGHARDQIGRTGAARHEADARPIGDAGQPIGHEGGSLFVADVDVLDARVVVKRVENVQEGRADDAENVPYPLNL